MVPLYFMASFNHDTFVSNKRHFFFFTKGCQRISVFTVCECWTRKEDRTIQANADIIQRFKKDKVRLTLLALSPHFLIFIFKDENKNVKVIKQHLKMYEILDRIFFIITV